MDPPLVFDAVRLFSTDVSRILDHLSWSSMSTYCSCPRKFYYRYVERAPQEFVSATLIFGGAFHRATESIHDSHMNRLPIPEIASLMESYDQAWAETREKSVKVVFPRTENAEVLRVAAERMISAYREHFIAAAAVQNFEILAYEYAMRFQMFSDVPPIEMRIDLLEYTSAGDVIVADLKTSRSRWSDVKIQESIGQLVLYIAGLAARAATSAKIVPRFIVITKAKTPAIQIIEPTIGQADVDRLHRHVCDVWDGIRKQVFVQRPSWQCAQCPYRRRCLGG